MNYLIYAAIALALFAGGFAAGSIMTTSRATQAALAAQQAQFEIDRKADQVAAKTALTAAVIAVNANDHTNDILAAVNGMSQSIMERVRHAPVTNDCSNSPAVRAYIDGLRARATPNVSVSNAAAH